MKSAGKIVLLLGGVIMMSFLLACDGSDDNSKADTPLEDVTATEGPKVSDVTRSDCMSRSRGYDDMLRQLVLWREDSNIITCQLLNLQEQCSFDCKVETMMDSDGTLLITYGDQSDDEVDCICYFNVTFHVDNAPFNHFHLRLQEKDIRWKSPYLLYEGDVTIGDTETMIKF